MIRNSAIEVLTFVRKNPAFRAVPGLFLSVSSGCSQQIWGAVKGSEVYIPHWKEIVSAVPDATWKPVSGEFRESLQILSQEPQLVS